MAPPSPNGNRKPPRPRIEMASSAASPQEAAAVIAAVERFIAETTPVPQAESRVNPWQRAALIEATSAKDAFASPWGEPRAWGERHSHRRGRQ